MHALYIYDNLGSPAALITTANSTAFTYKFDPYGAPELTEDSGGLGVPQTPFVFTGGLNDRTTGWVLNGARYYDPAEGRWTQRDTLDAPLDPGNANRYAYAANNPVNYIDPLGRAIWAAATALVEGLGDVANLAGLAPMLAGDNEAKVDGGIAMLAGATVSVACYTGAVALGFTTGFAGFGAAVACEGAGAAADYGVNRLLED